jgi:hypothetical protein
MFIKAGAVVFNTERIIKAQYRDDADNPVLDIDMAGGGTGDSPDALLSFEGDDARLVWKALCRSASEIVGVKYSG